MLRNGEYRDLVEELDVCLVKLDADHRIVYANQAFCSLTRKAAMALQGAAINTLFPGSSEGRPLSSILERGAVRAGFGEDVFYNSRWYEWRVMRCAEDADDTGSILLVGQDVTARKNRELALADREELYRQFVEHQPVGMLRSSIEGDGAFVMANRAAAELLGYPSVESLLETKVLDAYLDPGDREKLIERLLRDETVFGVEIESKKKDGSPMIASLSLQLVKDREGQPAAVDATILDVTAQKMVEESLRMTQFIYERAAVGIYRLDSDGKIHDVNEMAAKMLDYSKEELCAMRIWDIDPELDPLKWRPLWEDSLARKQSVFERRHRCKDGRFLPVEISSNIIEYKGKEYSIAFATDISERKRYEQALARSERMHRQAQAIARLGHWERGFDSDEIVWSDEMYRIFEIDKESVEDGQALLRKLVHCIPAEDLVAFDKAIARAIDTTGDIELVHRILLTGGRVKYVHVMANIDYGEDGVPEKMVGTVQDITARRLAELEKEQVERKLFQSQKLEAIGTLAGGIAHDFNNILTSILGFTQLSMGQFSEEDKLWKNLNEVLKAGVRARELVGHILTFSRQDDHVFEMVDMRVIITEVMKLLRASIPVNIDISLDLSDNCCKIHGVPVQFHQIFVNLCTNAYHAIGSGQGRIVISLQEVEIGPDDLRNREGNAPGRYAEVAVTDTGCGMEPAILDHIFDPYFSTKRKGEGTGLGLSVVHGIVKKHGGFIRVYSEPGKGTTFIVYLPCADNAVKASIPERERSVPTGTEAIVVVDDEASITAILAEMLGNLGYRVFAFNTPELALAYLVSGAEQVDLVITDLTMPELDGIGLAERIRASGMSMPIILQTGFSELVPHREIEKAGIAAVIRKPVLELELARCIRNILDTKRKNG